MTLRIPGWAVWVLGVMAALVGTVVGWLVISRPHRPPAPPPHVPDGAADEARQTAEDYAAQAREALARAEATERLEGVRDVWDGYTRRGDDHR